MTLEECLKKMEKVWMYLYRNPGASKEDAYKELGLREDMNNCPCCEYARQHRKGCETISMCGFCPLKDFWKEGCCMAVGSAYHVWENTSYLKKKAKAAFIIYRASYKNSRRLKDDREGVLTKDGCIMGLFS